MASQSSPHSTPGIPSISLRTRNSKHYSEPYSTTPPPIELEGELKYEISEILDSKIDNRQHCKLLYYVHWEGYQGTDEETLWLPATKLDHAKELVVDFHAQYPHKPGPLPL